MLEEGIVREPGDVDMGLILGIGSRRSAVAFSAGATPRRGGIVERLASTRPSASDLSRPRSLLAHGQRRARRFIRGPRRSARQKFGLSLAHRSCPESRLDPEP